MKKVLLVLGIFAIGISSCKKDKTTEPIPEVYAEENPMPEFLTRTGFNQVLVTIPGGGIEDGFSFKSKVNGKINAIVMKLPYANTSLRVTIWDNVSKAILRTEYVNVATGAVENIIAIQTFNILKDKEYLISMNPTGYYFKYRSDNASIAYPVTVGNITILSCSALATINQIFPSNLFYDRYYGDISFKFQQTN